MQVPNQRLTDFNDTFGRFILHCIAEERDSLPQTVWNDKLPLDVTLTVNGVEISAEKVIVSWVERMDALIDKRALDILADKMNSISNSFYEAKEKIDESICDLKEKAAEAFNCKYDRWEDTFQ